MTVTTAASTASFSNIVAEYIQKRAEENLRSVKPWSNESNGFNTNFLWPAGTDTIVFPYLADITYAASSASLTEGTMPTPAGLSIDSESMTPVQKGYVVGNADIAMFEYPALMLEAADRIAENAAMVLDTYRRSVLVAGTSVIYGGSATARSALTTGITSAKIQEAAARLRKTNVPTFPDGSYHAICTEEQIIALQTESTKGAWLDAALYSGAKRLMNGEAGQMWGVRFINAGSQQYIVSSGGSASADVHVGLIFGPGFAATTDLQTLRSYYAAPGGRSDLLEQSALIGWKWAGGIMVLAKRGSSGYRLETVQTTLS
jgi:N4-gp56 family major capsid protein